MTSSGTYLFAPSNAQLVLEGFDRIGIPFPDLTRHHWISARMSMNLELLKWSNKGINFWKVVTGTLAPVVGTATYTLPSNVLLLTELVWTVVNGVSSGVNADTWMVPISRTLYAQLLDKKARGTPSQYWFERLITPTINIYQTPSTASNTLLTYWGLQQIQDAGVAGGETPDVPYQAFDALAAGLAVRFAEKFKPELLTTKKAIYEETWSDFVNARAEPGPLLTKPNASSPASKAT